LRRVRVALATIGLVKVRVCPQQPFDLMPVGHCGYQFYLRVFLSSFLGSLFLLSFTSQIKERRKKEQIELVNRVQLRSFFV